MKRFYIYYGLVVVLVLGGAFLGYKYLFTKEKLTVPQGSKLLSLNLEEVGEIGGLTLTPREVLEDSRCPVGSNCIWEGTVKVRAEIFSETGNISQTFELDKVVEMTGWKITLIKVEPPAVTGVDYRDRNYTFDFVVKKVNQ